MRFLSYWLTGVLLCGVLSADPDAKALPRVLLLCDAVYQNPSREIAKALKDKAVVVYPSIPEGQVRNSTTVLAELDALLEGAPWDLIYVNVGLGDLIYRAPNMNSFRCLPVQAGGVRTTSPGDYERNLRRVIQRLKSTSSKIIWAQTTPILGSNNGIYEPGSEVEYNRIAAAVMSEEGIPVHDMHAMLSAVLDPKRSSGPFAFDKIPVHPTVVAKLLESLGLPPE